MKVRKPDLPDLQSTVGTDERTKKRNSSHGFGGDLLQSGQGCDESLLSYCWFHGKKLLWWHPMVTCFFSPINYHPSMNQMLTTASWLYSYCPPSTMDLWIFGVAGRTPKFRRFTPLQAWQRGPNWKVRKPVVGRWVPLCCGCFVSECCQKMSM